MSDESIESVDHLQDPVLEAVFDRYNRAVMAGLPPTTQLFVEALAAEGLRLSPLIPLEPTRKPSTWLRWPSKSGSDATTD